MSSAPLTQPPLEELLLALYAFQAQVEAGRDTACAPGCAACCTGRVYMTSLEGGMLLAEFRRLGRDDLLAAAVERAQGGAAPPAYTCNQLARCCLEQREPPAEANGPEDAGVCVLLEDGRCAAYAARPLACRVMASRQVCAPGGQASGDAWWLTLDTALLQIAEHLSLGGHYGALPAILAEARGQAPQGLLPCEPLAGLVAPPEHQARLQRELMPLFARPVRGLPLGQWMDRVRQAAPNGQA